MDEDPGLKASYDVAERFTASHREQWTIGGIVNKILRFWFSILDEIGLKTIPKFLVIIACLEVILYSANDEVQLCLIFDPKHLSQVWRFVSYMFVHKDQVHLFLNLVIQSFVGVPIEAEQGTWRCAAVFFGGGFAGSLGPAALSTSTPMAGASGGIYALLTSHYAHLMLNYEHTRHCEYRIIVPSLLIFSDVVHVAYHVSRFNNENPRIEWIAHVSGGISGLLVGFTIFSGSLRCKKQIQMLSVMAACLTVAGLGLLLHKNRFNL